MMNVVIGGGGSSECRSGCESGWTLYLQHSTSNYSVSGNQKKGSDKCHHYNNNRSKKHQKLDDEFDDDDDYEHYQKNNEFDEDLSMVSDASSGPPHFDHDIDDDDDDEVFWCNINTITGGGGGRGGGRKRQSMKLSSTHQFFKAPDFALDDTASSPNFISKKNGGQNSNGSSLKRMIDYSSQGFSATHLNHQARSNNFQEHYGVIQSPLSSTIQFQPNQWTWCRRRMSEKTKKRLKGMIIVPN